MILTLQKHLQASDHYSGLSVMRSDDVGGHWSAPDARPELDWRKESERVDIAVADVTPGFHGSTGKLLAIGAQVRYSKAGEQLDDKPRSNQTDYTVFDPQSGAWSRWSRLEMPPTEDFNFTCSGCAQFVVKPNGEVLVPMYVGRDATEPFSSTVKR